MIAHRDPRPTSVAYMERREKRRKKKISKRTRIKKILNKFTRVAATPTTAILFGSFRENADDVVFNIFEFCGIMGFRK